MRPLPAPRTKAQARRRRGPGRRTRSGSSVPRALADAERRVVPRAPRRVYRGWERSQAASRAKGGTERGRAERKAARSAHGPFRVIRPTVPRTQCTRRRGGGQARTARRRALPSPVARRPSRPWSVVTSQSITRRRRGHGRRRYWPPTRRRHIPAPAGAGPRTDRWSMQDG